MNTETTNPHLLSDEEFEALEELLTSDVVPEDCMNLEMLDGFLVAVISSPVPIAAEHWLPDVWSAHGDSVAFGSASQMQRAIRLVRRYYNELLATLGEPEGWEPFCYAAIEGDALVIGEEWIDGFTQGFELWPANWEKLMPEGDAEAVQRSLDELMAPWLEDDNDAAVDDETRLSWLEGTIAPLGAIRARLRALGLSQAEFLRTDEPVAPSPSAAGRNDPCPCGSGKKYKKCCGADA